MNNLFEWNCPICNTKLACSIDSVVGVNFDDRDKKVACSTKCWNTLYEMEGLR